MNLQRMWRGWHYLFIVLFVTGCTSSPKNDASSPKEPALHIVEIKQMKFQPREIIVSKGDQVTWINKDITDHDVTEQKAKTWASSPLATGESWSLTVSESADYYCNLHQVMKGKIVVQ